MKKHTLILHNHWALGDTICLSALVRDIQRAYPGQYDIHVGGHYSNVAWINNPYCQKTTPDTKGQLVEVEYARGISKCNNGGLRKHFLSWFHHSFETITGIRVPVTEPKGDIHLTPKESQTKPEGRYWVVVAGGKLDMTVKVWSAAYWQHVVSTLGKMGIRCIQAIGDFKNHFHPRLDNVEQFVGDRGSERRLFSLIAGAEGVICGITAAMHIAAVYDKPCVVIAGGREAPWWESYTNCFFPTSFGETCKPVAVEHTYLHTIGLLDCGIRNLDRGCWRTKTVPITVADTLPANADGLCRRPVTVGQQALPECMRMITPEHVIEAVMNYYEKGILPPIGAVKKHYPLPVVEPVQPTEPESEPEPAPSPAQPAQKKPLSTLGPAPKLGVWNKQWNTVFPKQVEPRVDETPDFALLDHPYIGGKFTLFVLGHADNLGLLERCIQSITDTCPRHRYDLRIALNQPSARVLSYAKSLGPLVSKLYVDTESRRKYPAMREMFWDEELPIVTPYLCWFDDDSWCRKANWMVQLAEAIKANHPQQGRLYGAWHYHDLMTVKRVGALREQWFKQASWWRGRNLYTGSGQRLATNGSQIVFASGGFWALATHVMREADIPDIRLNHNGGDITIGCQVTQAGYKVVNFSPKPEKAIIAWSDAPRRGYSEDFPWA